MKKLFFLFILLHLVGIMVYAQSFPMLHYNVENGLPSNTIYCIYKDSKGFTWVGTDKGIARYNGIRFEIFSTFNGLPDNEIFYFQEDKSGRIWLATYNGELCYYKNDTFHTAVNTPFLRNNFKPRSYIKSINIETDSSITFNFNSEYNFINIKDKYCKVFYVDTIFNKTNINDRIIYSKKINDNEYNVIAANVAIKIDSNTTVISTAPSSLFHSTFLQTNNQYYLISGLSFYTLNKPADTITIGPYVDGSSQINYLYSDGHEYFVITNKGAYYNYNNPLLNEKASAIGQDNKGDYWIGTLNNGIYIFSKNFKTSAYHPKVYYRSVKFSHCANNIIYFSTDSALYYFDGAKTSEIVTYKQHFNSDAAFLINEKSDFYCFRGTSNITILPVKPGNNKINFFKILDNSYKRLLSVGDKIYVQSMNGIHVADYSRQSNENILQPVTSQNGRIYCMAKSNDNYIWYATHNNVYKINSDYTIQTIPVKFGFKTFDFIGDYLVGVLHNNTFLLCSDINGRFNIDTIPAQNCIWEKFYKLDAAHVLIKTNNLYRMLTIFPSGSKHRYSIQVIEDAFLPLQCESFCSDQDNCYFFKDGAITTISISNLFQKPQVPRLFFRLLKTINNSYPVSDNLVLPFSESKNISILFSALSFSGKGITYQYSITKHNADSWREIQSEEINLGNPGYGDYVIKVRARTTAGDYSLPISFQLRIVRPFWAALWFISLVICVLILLAVIIVRQRISFIVKKKEAVHNATLRFVKSEYKALNALMNPHFIFNTLNNLQSLFNGNDKRLANKYLKVFADLIRQNMQNIAKEEISLQKEIDLVENYLTLEKLRFGDKLHYAINIQPGLDISEIIVPPLLIQPLVENSIKHGILRLRDIDGMIVLNIFERNDMLYIEVRDNGVGLQPANQSADDSEVALHESYGLDNIRKRIDQLSIIQDKKITFHIGTVRDDQSGQHSATVVTITIPTYY